MPVVLRLAAAALGPALMAASTVAGLVELGFAEVEWFGLWAELVEPAALAAPARGPGSAERRVGDGTALSAGGWDTGMGAPWLVPGPREVGWVVES